MEWQLCNIDVGDEDFVTLMVDGDLLILMHIENYRSGDCGGIRYVPVSKFELNVYNG